MTVSPKNNERSSATCATPRCATRNGWRESVGLPHDLDLTRHTRDQAGDRAEDRGLAGTVGTEQREHLPGVDLEIEIADDGDAAVSRIERAQRQYRHDDSIGDGALLTAFERSPPEHHVDKFNTSALSSARGRQRLGPEYVRESLQNSALGRSGISPR